MTITTILQINWNFVNESLPIHLGTSKTKAYLINGTRTVALLPKPPRLDQYAFYKNNFFVWTRLRQEFFLFNLLLGSTLSRMETQKTDEGSGPRWVQAPNPERRIVKIGRPEFIYQILPTPHFPLKYCRKDIDHSTVYFCARIITLISTFIGT